MSRTCFLAGLIVLLAAQLSAQFKLHVDYAVGPRPFAVAVGDFNGDGHPDLAVSNNGAGDEVGVVNNGVSILLGKGDGTFQPHVEYPAGLHPNSLLAADFNSDGKLDLAVTNGSSNAVQILLGNGDGTFQAPVAYATSTTPQWLVAADFNGDGRLDLATADYGLDYSSGDVSVLLGNGDGTFQSATLYPAGINPFGIMAADFNHDNKIDLAVVCNNGSYGLWILLGNGDGSFQSPTYYPSGYNPRVGAVSDLNSDGHLDIAIANCISNNISIYMGDGNGHFAPQVNYGAGGCPQTLVAGDFDGDGKLDLVTANSQTNDVSLFKGNGDGTFQTNGSVAVGNNPFWVTVADLDGDTAPDLIVTNTNDNTISVLLNQGTDFSIAVSAPTPATVQRGQTSTSTVSMALLTSYGTPQVNLTCSVQPAQSAPTCSFNPNPATFANSLATATLTLETTATAAWRGNSLPFLWFPIAGLALAGLGVRSPRKKLIASVLGLILVGGLLLQVACGGTSGGQKTQPQTYTITVTGAAGANQHSATTTLTVN
jgi:hypothetical protein